MTLIDLKTSPQNILIVARGGIGNVLMFMPTLKGLKKRFPISDVYMLVDSKGSYELLSGESSIKEVILYDQRANGIIRLLKFILTLRRKHFNLAIVMHPG